MFTGLIEDIGTVVSFSRRGAAGVLTISTALPVREIALGDSIAVNGVCLTATSCAGTAVTFDVSPESLSCTTLGALKTGGKVNLERAMRLGDRMGGHIVTGHVDCIARLARISEVSGNHILEFTLPPETARYLIAKGSVAIDGISLTVNRAGTSDFSVNIIPLTRTATTLAGLKVGDAVNIETDIIGRYVERLLQPGSGNSGLTVKTLAENGFM